MVQFTTSKNASSKVTTSNFSLLLSQRQPDKATPTTQSQSSKQLTQQDVERQQLHPKRNSEPVSNLVNFQLSQPLHLQFRPHQ
ncbi:hypothetical protein PCANC_10774 [Puccinia coronata f. sp. avenae]|uniref:Uncharacterized protein n=1 Tax=Puccinia coronata f. sp. avenae TaxID=200324 RepID=A0A2N5VSP3_9BASI|nr:hypothetical protein PCANC_10774 [Puccinia coronata f. sp. avenae]